MIFDVLCSKCGGVVKAIAPNFLMTEHGLISANCMGIGMPGTPINLIHVSAAPPRVLINA